MKDTNERYIPISQKGHLMQNHLFNKKNFINNVLYQGLEVLLKFPIFKD